MKKSSFIADSISFAWNSVWKNVSYWVLLVLIWFGYSIVINFVNTIPLVGIFVGWFLQAWFGMGVLMLILSFVDGNKASYKILWSTPEKVLPYLGLSFLQGLIVAVGTILLIVPGIIWGLTYMFAPYVFVDQKLGVMDSLKRSGEITKGRKWELFGFVILLMLINMAGALVFGIGLVITIPVVMIAYAKAYRTFSGGNIAYSEMSENEPSSTGLVSSAAIHG